MCSLIPDSGIKHNQNTFSFTLQSKNTNCSLIARLQWFDNLVSTSQEVTNLPVRVQNCSFKCYSQDLLHCPSWSLAVLPTLHPQASRNHLGKQAERAGTETRASFLLHFILFLPELRFSAAAFWQWQLFHNVSPTESREICDIFSGFYGVITFSWVPRGVAASPLPFYHFSNTPEFWRRVRSAAFSRTREDKCHLSSSVICQSLFLLRQESTPPLQWAQSTHFETAY